MNEALAMAAAERTLNAVASLTDRDLSDAYARAAEAHLAAERAHEAAAVRLDDLGHLRSAKSQRESANRAKLRAITYARYARQTRVEAG